VSFYAVAPFFGGQMRSGLAMKHWLLQLVFGQTLQTL
jgi:hypothetical protein